MDSGSGCDVDVVMVRKWKIYLSHSLTETHRKEYSLTTVSLVCSLSLSIPLETSLQFFELLLLLLSCSSICVSTSIYIVLYLMARIVR